MVAEFKSKHAGLMFLVDSNMKKFVGGRYVTEDPKDIEVLDRLAEVERVDTPVDDKPKKPAKGDK